MGRRYSDRDTSSCYFRHEKFAWAYLTPDRFGLRAICNATTAAIRAGYSAKSARKNAWRLLRYPDTQAKIRQIRDTTSR